MQQKHRYNTRSSKFKQITTRNLKNIAITDLEKPIEIRLPKNGYNGSFIIEISKDKNFFIANSNHKDKTRFPARIRGAASALKDMKLYGKFEISHNDGILKIVTIS